MNVISLSQASKNRSIPFDRKGLADGVYIYKISTSSKPTSGKLIIK
jgi:hypothetical protein